MVDTTLSGVSYQRWESVVDIGSLLPNCICLAKVKLKIECLKLGTFVFCIDPWR